MQPLTKTTFVNISRTYGRLPYGTFMVIISTVKEQEHLNCGNGDMHYRKPGSDIWCSEFGSLRRSILRARWLTGCTTESSWDSVTNVVQFLERFCALTFGIDVCVGSICCYMHRTVIPIVMLSKYLRISVT